MSLTTQKSTNDAADPLAPLTLRIGGKWYPEGGYYVFEWSIGKKSVKLRSYFVVDGRPKRLSEG